MQQKEALQILHNVGAIITNSHVVYTSGKHGAVYINKDALYPHIRETSSMCRAIAKVFVNDKVETVIAPAIGGVVLSQWIAHHLSEMNHRNVFSVYAEKDGKGTFCIRRGYGRFVNCKRVLVVEDVFNTGGSAKKVIEIARVAGGNIIGLGVLCNRGGVLARSALKIPKFSALVTMELEAWNKEDCPLCKQGVPINTSVGKG